MRVQDHVSYLPCGGPPLTPKSDRALAVFLGLCPFFFFLYSDVPSGAFNRNIKSFPSRLLWLAAFHANTDLISVFPPGHQEQLF